jgi:sigma-E factor negative regulatory protein RseA
MGTGELSKQQISAFADGELPNDEVPAVMAVLRATERTADWDIYHQIGDVLRSETMAAPVSALFTENLAARLAAEPPLLAPKLRLVDRLRPAWPVAAAAMAAALTGFVIAPQFMRTDATDSTVITAAESVVRSSVIAKTDLPAPSDDTYALNDYIRIHHSSHPSLYGAAQLARPVNLKIDSDH